MVFLLSHLTTVLNWCPFSRGEIVEGISEEPDEAAQNRRWEFSSAILDTRRDLLLEQYGSEAVRLAKTIQRSYGSSLSDFTSSDLVNRIVDDEIAESARTNFTYDTTTILNNPHLEKAAELALGLNVVETERNTLFREIYGVSESGYSAGTQLAFTGSAALLLTGGVSGLAGCGGDVPTVEAPVEEEEIGGCWTSARCIADRHCIDDSGSMSGGKWRNVKQAALNYIK